MGLGDRKAGQIEQLGPPVWWQSQLPYMHIYPQGRITLACGEGLGPSLQSAGASYRTQVIGLGMRARG